MDSEVAALERRLAALQSSVGATSTESPSLHIRLHELAEKLGQVENRVDPPNLAPLRHAYEQNKKLLSPGFLAELKLQSQPQSAGLEETTKAIVLTSESHVQTMATNAQRLQELERYASLPAIAPDVHAALTRVETNNLLLAQQVMARHARVEALLLQYSTIMSRLSHKFQLYDELLTTMEARV
ncbi:hypothetical protein ACHHYP_15797 [Achlya hypogyna]|uniref:Uncharacterized protein n=1 Tax=Achlya hypogyna TaxID=1202772 RepID=A0A1V9ZEP0_ACHHY|nr:hypothetical protein ACHHYP_15797 [Achlya hypogyna]